MRYVMLSLIGLFMASPAQAARITNLDEVAHELTISVSQNAPGRTYQLAPNQTVNAYAPNGWMQLQGKDWRPYEYFNEYVIWPGGDLQIQMRRSPGGKGVF